MRVAVSATPANTAQDALVAPRVLMVPGAYYPDHARNGILVEPDNEREFASAIRSLILDSEQAESFGAAARDTIVDRYPIQKTAPAWLAVYRELAGVP